MAYNERDTLILETLFAFENKITKEEAIKLVDAFLNKEQIEKDRISKIVWSGFKGFPNGFPFFHNED